MNTVGSAPGEEWLDSIRHKNISISKPIDDLDEVLRLVRDLSIRRNVGGQPLIFRGQGDASKKLIPSAYRDSGRETMGRYLGMNFKDEVEWKIRWLTGINKEIDAERIEKIAAGDVQAEFEFKVIQKFILEADRSSIPIPELTVDAKSKLLHESDSFIAEWPPSGLYAAIGLAQHAGVPTRFLDWSSDAYAAAYFAAYSAFSKHKSGKGSANFIVWILNTGQYKELSTLKDIGLGQMPGSVPHPYDVIHVPSQYNQRLAAQQGLFVHLKETYQGVMDGSAPFDFVTAISSLPELNSGPYLEAIRIPIELSKPMIGILDAEGFTSSKYFPDIEGVLKTLELRGKLA